MLCALKAPQLDRWRMIQSLHDVWCFYHQHGQRACGQLLFCHWLIPAISAFHYVLLPTYPNSIAIMLQLIPAGVHRNIRPYMPTVDHPQIVQACKNVYGGTDRLPAFLQQPCDHTLVFVSHADDQIELVEGIGTPS